VAYIYPPLKKKLYPTYEEMSKAVQNADKEGPSRDTRPLMSCLQRMAESSPRVMSGIQTRQTALTAFSWELTPIIDGAADADLEKAKQARLRLRKIIDRLLMWHTDTPAFGCSLVELSWDSTPTSGSFKVPTVLKRYAPIEIERTSADPSTLQILADQSAIARSPIDLTSPGMTLADTDSLFQTGGLLRPLVWFDIARNEAMQEWTSFNEKIKGIILARLEEWASKADEAAAKSALTNLTQNQWALTSKGVEFQFVDLVNQLGAASFKDFIAYCEDAISILLLGQANTTSLPDGGGSRAALEILNLIRADIHYSDMSRMERLINDQLLTADAQINLGLDESPFEFEIQLAEEQDREKNTRIITDAVDAGIPLKRTEVYASIGFSPPADTDEVIVKQTPGLPSGGLLP
jgi:phage gp29-like protein